MCEVIELDDLEKMELRIWMESLERKLERIDESLREALNTDEFVDDELRWPKRVGYLEGKISVSLDMFKWVFEDLERIKKLYEEDGGK